MLHISTSERPAAIAPGEMRSGPLPGDESLLFLDQRIAQPGAPVYVRLMAEMNAYRNRYSAFDVNGARAGASHSTAAFPAGLAASSPTARSA